MAEQGDERRRTLSIALISAAIGIALLPDAAEAHRLNVFASSDGTIIRGSVYFQGMRAARNAPVTVVDADGAVLADIVTDEAGKFAFQAVRRVDHRIVADLSDGHRAEFVVSAEQLSPSLPAPVLSRAPAENAPQIGAQPAPQAGVPAAAIEAIVESAVARHVGPLRQQIAAYEDRIRWHDVLGGIGYIIGMTGLAGYFLARRGRDREGTSRR